jgi:hypothetical protein
VCKKLHSVTFVFAWAIRALRAGLAGREEEVGVRGREFSLVRRSIVVTMRDNFGTFGF